ncbi:JAB domain-containing protein [Flavobacterium sp. NPDC079362]|uniref:JAB domain-containing protein n=1 Tax=Flavobacterium sp. NPDC079362 TaxID=3390566 RepID=UPI003CFE3F53
MIWQIRRIARTAVDNTNILLSSYGNATSLIHNHPSGNSQPMKQINREHEKEAGTLVDITLLDSLIITTESNYSFADGGAFQSAFITIVVFKNSKIAKDFSISILRCK